MFSAKTHYCIPWVWCLLCLPALAQTDVTPPSDEAPAAGTPDALSQEQAQLADKYRRLEDLIFKMADFEATSNPRRAALLKQAYKQSKDRLTQSQLNAIVKLLAEQQYKRALDGQEVARKDLDDLLQLLLSEDRSDRLKSETEKIKEYIKELKRIERIQRGVRGRTEGASDPRDLSKDQEKVADRTGDLAEQLEQDAAQSKQAQGSQGSDGQSGAPKEQQEGEPSEQEPAGDQQPKDQEGEPKATDEQPKAKEQEQGDQQGKPSEGEQQGQPDAQPGEPSEGEQGEQKKQEGAQSQSPQGQPQSGQPPSEGEGSEQQQPPQDENPAQKRIREAEQKMREAQQKLEEAKRSESVEKQTEALEKLQEAIAELEEILRQLREEELERMLALLEGRFRKMLEMELEVYEGTLRLAKIPLEKRGRTVEIRASKLAFDQRKIAGEADRALTLLLEEGSSIAFPEVVEQMRDDMEEVAARLDQVKVERITQELEEEIISTLEELIEALQKAQQDLEEGRQSPPGQPGQSSDPPLVDILAELKMIRSLQMRVNSRTKRYARLLDDPEDPVGQAMEEDLRQAIGKLSELEMRIQQITRDIALGKNQ